MMLALMEAKKAGKEEEIPIGAIIVKNGEVISRAYNQKEANMDATKHAEIIAIRKASKKLNDWRLNNCLLFVTLEPCLMCMGAIIESRISNVFCGTKNIKYHKIVKQIAKKNNINIKFGILKEECEEIIKTFFENKRKR
jgi:tRNA(adenine34) deaminase